MARFNGIPIEDEKKGGKFGGIPIAEQTTNSESSEDISAEPQQEKTGWSSLPGRAIDFFKNKNYKNMEFPAAGEAALSATTGTFGTIVGGLVGLGSYGILQQVENVKRGYGILTGNKINKSSALDKADKVTQAVQGALTYKPRTEGGRDLTEIVASPMIAAQAVGGEIQRSAEKQGYPLLGTIGNVSAQSLGVLLPIKGGKIAGKTKVAVENYITDTLPTRLYASATKMPLSKKWTSVLPGKEVSKRTAAVEEGLKSKINTSKYGVAKAKANEAEISKYIDGIIEGLSKDPEKGINTSEVLDQGLKSAYAKAKKSSDPVGAKKIVDDIAKKFQEHGESLTIRQAHEIKKQMYDEVKYGAQEQAGLTTQLNETAKKGIAHELMVNIEEFYPNLKELNKTDGARIDLVEAIEKAVERQANNNVIPLGAKVLYSPKSWPLAAFDWMVGNFKSELAIALAKANRTGKYDQYYYPKMLRQNETTATLTPSIVNESATVGKLVESKKKFLDASESATAVNETPKLVEKTTIKDNAPTKEADKIITIKVPAKKGTVQTAKGIRGTIIAMGGMKPSGEVSRYVPINMQSKSGLTTDQILTRLDPEWKVVIKNEEDLFNAISKNIERPSVTENIIEKDAQKAAKKYYEDHPEEIEPIPETPEPEPLSPEIETKINQYLDASLEKRSPVKEISLSELQQSHIKKKIFQGKKPAADRNKDQHTVLTGGPPGAGKSTSWSSIGGKKDDYILGDSDYIKQLAGYEDQAEAIHEASSKLNKEIVNDSIDKGYDTIYDSVLSNFDLADSLIKKTLNKDGYATITFTDVDAETSLTRSLLRVVKGETIRRPPAEISVKGYNNSLPTFRALYEKYKGNKDVDFELWNNNTDFQEAIRVFEQTEGKLLIYDKKLFDNFINLKYVKDDKSKGVRYERTEKIDKGTIASQRTKIRARINESIRRSIKGSGATPTSSNSK